MVAYGYSMASNSINTSEEKTTQRDEHAAGRQHANGGGELSELRRILVQPDEVGEVLPEAFSASAEKSSALADATLPVVESNIYKSARERPEVLSEALFPIIGPAIRKAIAEALGKMVQSMNQTMENSLSPKGLKWRIEAWQTGKPFAEVVMLHSLVYRVEEVFLIHKDTGLLLQHASATAEGSKDADMVSAMLTAIQDFVHDSFKASEDATLNSLQIKELSVWIETGPDALIAAVIRGNAPLAYRETLEEAIEGVHARQKQELEEFNGESSVFVESRPLLDNCLQSQAQEYGEKKGGLFTPTNILVGLLGLLLLIFGFFYIRDYMRWSGYVSRLKAEPGIVVAEVDRGFWRHSVSGLRDPLAADPDSFLGENGYDKDDIISQWKPYQDLSPDMVLKRANKLLEPPEGVKLSFENGVLKAEGSATPEWFEQAKRQAPLIAGVNEFKTGQDEFAVLKNRIEAQYINFNCGTTDYSSGEEKKLAALRNDLEKYADKGNAKIEITGTASSDGSGDANARISQARADKVLSEILGGSEKLRKLDESKPDTLRAIGKSSEGASGCKVTFKVN